MGHLSATLHELINLQSRLLRSDRDLKRTHHGLFHIVDLPSRQYSGMCSHSPSPVAVTSTHAVRNNSYDVFI